MQRKTTLGILQALCLLCFLTSSLMASDPLATWRWSNPLPNGNSFNGVIYAKGLIVGVGNAGTIMTSTNLTTAKWVQSPVGTNTSYESLNAIAYSPDNGTFVVVGNATGLPIGANNTKGGMILTSTDGTNWYNQGWSNTNTRNLACAAYGAGQFVISGQQAEIWSSPDGTNWTQRTSPLSGKSYNLNAMTYRPDVGFVGVGDAKSSVAEVVTSPDGINWFLQNSAAPTYSLNGITWGYVTNADSSVTTNFVTVGGSSSLGIISTSPGGTNWTGQTVPTGHPYDNSRFYGVAFSPGVGYIIVGASGVILTSVDGTNWNTSYSDLSQAGNNFAGAVYAADLGYFIGVGSSGTVETSPTGAPATWTAEFSGRPENLTGVARGNVNFVAVGNNVPYLPYYGLVLTSPDGSNWHVRNSQTSSIKLNNVTYGAGTFVAVGNTGTIVTSADEGTNWTVQTSPTSVNLSGVSYLTNSTGNIFLVTGASGAILTSPDGANWTTQPSGTSSALYCAAYGANTYVVGGASGAVLTSPDGSTWTAQTSGISGSSRDLNGLAYGNGTFVAACGHCDVLTSPDGVNWSQQTTPLAASDSTSSVTFQTVSYINGMFVMAASDSIAGALPAAVLTSPDGTNWVIVATPQTSSSFKAIAYAPDTYLVVGSGGTIMQAGTLNVTGPTITYTYESGTLTLTWPGGGSLLAAPVVTGPYTNVPDATSPWPITPLSEPSMFYRVQQP